MERQSEPELMDSRQEATAYAVADFSRVNQAFVDRLLELTGSLHQANVIDLGTGPADIPIRLWRGKPQWKIAAVDGAAVMLQIAAERIERERAVGNIELVLADAKSTGLPPKSFDIVISNSILHHVSDAGMFWRKARRLGKPGGHFFFRDLARPVDEMAARQIVEKHVDGESALLQEEFYRSLLSAYTIDEVRRQLADANLKQSTVVMSSDRHLDAWGRFSDRA